MLPGTVADMNIVMIAGFWLDGDSWGEITATLAERGHDVHTPTLPGKRPGERDLSGIGLRTHVDAVLDIVDTLEGPVVLVGHSGGGSIAWAVADARPSAVARVVFVDALPFPSGSVINDELPVDGDGIPLPDWGFFEAEDLVDLTDELRDRFRAIAKPEPAGVAVEPQQLSNDERFSVPVTVIACEFTEATIRGAIAGGAPWASELASLMSLDIVELPTGHWPQFTKPVELGASILTAVGDSGDG